MAAPTKGVDSAYLAKGAYLALEQGGLLLRDANCLYRSGAYPSAVVLAAFAREEFGRAGILLDLRSKVIAGEVVTTARIERACESHVTKQEWAVLSTMMTVEDKESGLGKLLQTKLDAHPHSEEWKAADRELKKIDEVQRKRAKNERHKQRMRSLYVEPDDFGGWNRPILSASQRGAYDILIEAGNDYAIQCQKVHPELLKGHDDKLLQELNAWSERPQLPAQEQPPPQPPPVSEDAQ